MTDHDPDIPKQVEEEREAAEKKKAADFYDRALGVICQALMKLGIDSQTIAVSKQGTGDYIVTAISLGGKKRAGYLRVDRDGKVTLLGEQIAPPKADAHPAESK
jgi:hypothetical protein